MPPFFMRRHDSSIVEQSFDARDHANDEQYRRVEKDHAPGESDKKPGRSPGHGQ